MGAGTEKKCVVILAAGRGTRMGEAGRALHKALFPVADKAVLTHVLEAFPAKLPVVVAVGFLGEQVQSYLRMAHPERQFTFVEIPDYDRPGSGPGASLLHCRPFIPGPFYLCTADTIITDTLPPLDHNWMGVASIENPSAFCVVATDSHGQIVDIHDKKKDSPFRRAFVGLAGVVDCGRFWEALAADETLIASERQLSNGFRGLMGTSFAARQVGWLDTGTVDGWQMARRYFEGNRFDFSKPGEVTYLVQSRVVKWFEAKDVARRRVGRAKHLYPLVPIVHVDGEQFYWYERIAGLTAYENLPKPEDLLPWLEQFVFTRPAPPSFSNEAWSEAAYEFYRDKTYARVERALEQSNLDLRPSLGELLAKIQWEEFAVKAIPRDFHGDLQLDNIIVADSGPRFQLIDWRDSFGSLSYGDLYYDLGKLNASLRVNFNDIKRGVRGSPAPLEAFKAAFDRFCRRRGYDLAHIELVTTMIYLNMAPLHQPPLGEFLLRLGHERLVGSKPGPRFKPYLVDFSPGLPDIAQR
jgi:dTDP-glucose pyrophosphorylase